MNVFGAASPAETYFYMSSVTTDAAGISDDKHKLTETKLRHIERIQPEVFEGS
jgi:hypothetical protein